MMRLIALTFSLTLPASLFAGEVAVLDSGFRMRIERHEVAGTTIRLFTSKDAFVELPSSSVAAIEVEEHVPEPPKPQSDPSASQQPVQTVPPPAPDLDPQQLVSRAADSQGLPASLLHLVARAESGYNPKAISPKGAIGIMQLMPATAASLNADPHNPEENVEAGARFLRELLLQYKDHPDQLRLALAAYNAGPGAVKRYNGVPPYRETQLYVEKIVEAYRKTLSKNTRSR
jgi:hypothetical protein